MRTTYQVFSDCGLKPTLNEVGSKNGFQTHSSLFKSLLVPGYLLPLISVFCVVLPRKCLIIFMLPLLPLGHFTNGYEILGFEKGEMFVSACSIYI